MARSISEVRVVGLGKVGELLATLLIDSGFAVTAYDFRERGDLAFPTRIERVVIGWGGPRGGAHLWRLGDDV